MPDQNDTPKNKTKKFTFPNRDAKKIVETVVDVKQDKTPEPYEAPKTVIDTVKEGLKKAPADSAMAAIKKAPDVTVSKQGVEFDGTLDKPSAERLANKLNSLEKGDKVDLQELANKVIAQIEDLHREKARRSQQNRRTIASLRASDPKGKKTCGRCGYRVDVLKMDVKKELCEVCAS